MSTATLTAPTQTLSIQTLETNFQAVRGGPIVTTSDGRVLWFTQEPDNFLGLGDGVPFPPSYIAVRESMDCGQTWGEPRVVASGTPEYGLLPHAALQLRGGDLIHIFARFFSTDAKNFDLSKCKYLPYILRSRDGGQSWSEAEELPVGECYVSDVLGALQLAGGRVLYPFGFLTPRNGSFAISALYSDDEGRTWQRSESVLRTGGEGGHESGGSEPSVAELSDGRLWMLIRTPTGVLWQSFSHDGGATWEPAQPTQIPSSNSPATLLRLSSGKIFSVWNDCNESKYARHRLSLAMTTDGKSTSALRLIDTDAHSATYPFLCEAPDGALLVSYSCSAWTSCSAKLARVPMDWLETTT